MPISKKTKLTITATLILAVIIVIYWQRGAVNAELYNLDLVPKQQPFTELYFQNSTSLPRETIANTKASFTFTINNVEGVTTTYPYNVYFEYPTGERVVFVSSTVVLGNNVSTTINVSHIFGASNLTGEVVVDLSSLNNQSIDFLLPDTNP